MAEIEMTGAPGGRFRRAARRNGEAMAAAVRHPLLRAMREGTVTDEAFERYLALEGSFVALAVRAAACCLACEQDEAVLVRLGRMIGDLAGDQLGYMASVGGGVDAWSSARSPLHVLVEGLVYEQDVARIAVAMASAETLYERWCGEAAVVPLRRPDRVTRWIDVHTAPAFLDGADLWRSLVDRIDPLDLDDAALDAVLLGTLAAEDAFHSIPLQSIPLQPTSPKEA